MDVGGQCPNMHWYHCKEHNPEAKPKHGQDTFPPMTNQDEVRELLKDITHKRSDNDIRGSCGSPCYQCEQDKQLIAFFNTLLAKKREEIENRATVFAIGIPQDPLISKDLVLSILS